MINKQLPLKILFWSLLLSLLTISMTQGFCYELQEETASCPIPRPLLEFKAGYFSFSNSILRKVYNRGGLDVQLCGSYPLWNLSDRWSLHAYGALEYFQRSGRSINGQQQTSVWSLPVNIGIKPVYTINARTQYYFAIGPRYFYIHQHNDSSYVYRNESGKNLGGFVNTGFHYILCNHLVIDIFGEYSYGKIHFPSQVPVYTRNIQVGGFTWGAGLGYTF